MLAGEDDLTGVGVGRRGEVAFVVLLHVEHERGGRVAPHPLGVAEHEPDAGGQADDEDDESQSEAVAEGDVGEAGGDAGGERVDGRAEHADATAEEDDQRPGEGVVAGGDHHGDDEDVEGEALLGHPERRAADGEDGHQDRDHPAFVTTKAGHEQGDAGLDGAGLHRDADEAADDEDEQGDVDGAEQVTAVEHVDVAGGRILDAVEAVDRRLQRVDDDPRRGRFDLLVGAGDRGAFGVEGVPTGGDDPRRQRGDHDEGEQDRVRGGQREAGLAGFGFLARGLGVGCGRDVTRHERLLQGGEGRLAVGWPVAVAVDRWRVGGFDVFDAEAGEGVDEGDERVEEVEEGEREVLDGRHAEDSGHVGAAAVPRHERRGHGAGVLDGSGEHARGQAAGGRTRSGRPGSGGPRRRTGRR